MAMLDSSLPGAGRRIAMLIDGDNTPPSSIESIVAETGKYGLVTIRRIYGDWTEPEMKSWKETLHIHAIQPVQQFRNTTGKNATDSAMIIDAMDILHQGVVSGVCLVSSDSDYTRLATRVREKGLFVMGIGRMTTPRSFVNACEIFVYLENLVSETQKSSTRGAVEKAEAGADSKSEPLGLLNTAFGLAVQEDGWANLGAVGNFLRQLDPGFDPRTYGHRQLSQLVRAHPDVFEVRGKRSGSGPAVVHIRLKV